METLQQTKTHEDLEIMDKFIFDHKRTYVYQTKNYSKFGHIQGNRKVNELHVKRLMNSFNEKYLISPITVNEDYGIVDGQHRFEAAKRIGLPIYYIFIFGSGLNEVQLLNTNTKDWGKQEHLDSYCQMGHPEYLKMKKFMEDHPWFGISASERICTNSYGGVNNNKQIEGVKGSKAKQFQEGRLIIPSLENSYKIAKKIKMIEPFYSGYNRATFVSTMITMFKHEDYDHSQMIRKLEIQPNALDHCNSSTQYKEEIEKIYNFKSRNKVSLKY